MDTNCPVQLLCLNWHDQMHSVFIFDRWKIMFKAIRFSFWISIRWDLSYDNCTRKSVYQFLVLNLKTSPDVAEILTNIITYNGGITTGCPTSQIMAFYAYSDMFSEIADAAKQCGCKFTLYVDDMTFPARNRSPLTGCVKWLTVYLENTDTSPSILK